MTPSCAGVIVYHSRWSDEAIVDWAVVQRRLTRLKRQCHGVAPQKPRNFANGITEVQRIIGVGAECNLDDLRNVADRVKCGLGEFPDLIDELHLNGILLKKANGNWQVLS